MTVENALEATKTLETIKILCGKFHLTKKNWRRYERS